MGAPGLRISDAGAHQNLKSRTNLGPEVVQKTKGLTHLLMNQALAKSVLNGTEVMGQSSNVLQRQFCRELISSGYPHTLPCRGIPLFAKAHCPARVYRS